MVRDRLTRLAQEPEVTLQAESLGAELGRWTRTQSLSDRQPMLCVRSCA